jgi:hypothetical protein
VGDSTQKGGVFEDIPDVKLPEEMLKTSCRRRKTTWPPIEFLLFGITFHGHVKTLQEIGEAAGNSFFQEISVIATKVVADGYQIGPPDPFCLISLHNLHVRSSRG